MAERADLEFTYSLIDRIFRLSLGELADFSGAKYDGDFSLTLEQAQARKHEYVAEQIEIDPERRVLDLGCGWGGLLNFIRNRGAIGIGVPMSKAQVAACRRHGLDVHLYDARLLVGQGQLMRSVEPHVRVVSSSNGRLDYIETIRQWNARIGAPSIRKTLLKLALLPRWLRSSDFRLAYTSGVSANKVCFERELLDHYRLVFEKH